MLTVIMATHNGSRLLPRVLDSYLRLHAPRGGWKLVVIDNGSTDGTAGIVRAYLDRLPLTLLSEGKPGKNAALNTGLAALEGDLAVFTDDDAIPEPDWLEQFRTAADERLGFNVFGGTILPSWERPPPDWVLAHVPLGPAFTLLDLPSEGPADAHGVFGPNMAMRASVLEKGLRFDEDIGPKGKDYPMGSETEFLMRAAKAGHKTWFCKYAKVGHIIRPHQVEEAWLAGRARRFGRGQYRLHQSGAGYVRWFGIPRYLVGEISVNLIKYTVLKLSGNPGRTFAIRWHLNYLVGKAIEARLALGEESK